MVRYIKTSLLLLLLIVVCGCDSDERAATNPDQSAESSTPFARQPAVVDSVKPAYPPLALAGNIEANVVNTHGTRIRHDKVVIAGQGSLEMFVQPSINAVMKFRFTPALNAHGDTVRAWLTVPIKYRLSRHGAL
jgi:hypothetical protein